MSDPINDGGPAYPGLNHTPGYGACKVRRMAGEETLFEEYATGMSLRDKVALELFVAYEARDNETSSERLAVAAFVVADIFLKVRNNKKPQTP